MNDIAEPVAIIGLAGRFPGARNVHEYWDNLCAGRESVEFPTDADLLAFGVPRAALQDPNYVKAIAQAPEIDLFDADFFGFTPREAQLSDPQIRLLLETAHSALDDAGYANGSVLDIGVFAAAGVNRYGSMDGKTGSALRSASGLSLGVLNNTDYVATLMSYKFNLKGPSMTVQTACSSSMVATHLAVQALRSGGCRIALAGGAAVEYPVGHGHWWAPGSPLTRDGHVRPFDRAAGGTLFGTGAGVVALKLLRDAVADGDNIRAVIRGIAVNNDGNDKIGFSAPSVAGQSAAIIEAMTMAGVRPDQVSYVEAHATGTPLGDPIEIAAFRDAYTRLSGEDLEPQFCAIASVKGNVGHLGHAAGTAGLVKAVLALENEKIPPSINFREPNPQAELGRSPFHVNDTLRDWPRVAGRPRMAAVNSLGIGGTNVHTVLEEAPVRVPAETGHRPAVVVWSARTAGAEQEYRPRLAECLAGRDVVFDDVVTTLQRGRAAHDVRSAVVVSNAQEAAAALTGVAGAPGVIAGTAATPRPVAFLFPGQGSQHAGMAAGLYGAEAGFTRALDECLALLDEHGVGATATWRSATDDERLRDTALAQPLLFAVEYALSRMWLGFGARPARLLGHSVGELVAATVAGVFPLADAVRLVASRARAMAAMPPGQMLAISAPVNDVVSALPPGVDVAVVNGPRQTVVSGQAPALDAFARQLSERKISSRVVRTSHAFHGADMAPAAKEFLRAFDGIAARTPAIPVYSGATGRLLTETEAADPGFWAGQLNNTVWFGRAVDALLADGDHTLLEVGPGQALTSLVKPHPAVTGGGSVAVPTLPRRGGAEDDWECVLTAVARLWTSGVGIDWPAVTQRAPGRFTSLPAYPYQRKRHWIDVEDDSKPVAGETVSPTPPEPATPFTTFSWTPAPRTATPAAHDGEHALAILPEDRGGAARVIAALHQAGLRVIPVRPAQDYQETGSGFRVRAGSTADVEELFAALARRQIVPRILVHAATVGTWAAPTTATVAGQLELACDSLVRLVQHGARRGAPGLLVLTERSANISGGEPVDPVKATLHGFVRTLPLEEPGTVAKLVELGGDVGEDELAEEIRDWRSEIVALRGDRRWIEVERPYRPRPAAMPALRDGGVYLLTGGLGGLGIEVAKSLARTGLGPRLVLLGRTGLDPHATDERTERVRAGLDEIEDLGASYEVVTADVADPSALRVALDDTTATLGPVSGVFHLAGVAGDGMVQFRTREQIDAVLAPKVAGTLALAEAFGGRPPLDFFVTFSSTAAVRGLRGSGDYAAANAFLDAYANAGQAPSRRVLSINWPAWNTVGMAVPGLLREAERAWRYTLVPGEYAVLDEHLVNSRRVLPGTGHLDLVVRAFREVVLDGAPAAVRLRDVVFQAPLVVETVRRVEISFEPRGDAWGFTVRSQDATGGDDQVHVVGVSARATSPARKVDLPALVARMSDRRRPPARTGGPKLVGFGPRWDNVVEIGFDPANPHEKLMALREPAAFETEVGSHEVHPPLLDNATGYARDSERDPEHLPFMYREIVVRERLPASLHSHIRRRQDVPGVITADIDLITPDGRVVVEVEGFTMRQVAAGFEPRGQAEPTPTAPSPPQTGIDPDTGTRLLLDLLNARTPRQVCVAAFRDGAPMPLPDRPANTAGEQAPPAQQEPAATTNGAGGVEGALRALWTAALGIEDIGADDDFFELGGSSLTAVDLMSNIRDRFAVDLSIAALFEYPTLGALARELSEQGAR
ncbi:type I polyketide synthase [Amycolatopsis sp. NPDC005003]